MLKVDAKAHHFKTQVNHRSRQAFSNSRKLEAEITECHVKKIVPESETF